MHLGKPVLAVGEKPLVVLSLCEHFPVDIVNWDANTALSGEGFEIWLTCYSRVDLIWSQFLIFSKSSHLRSSH